MAFGYRVYERKNSVPNAKTPRIAVATAKSIGTISSKELAEDIADRCTLHRSDVIAVLDALSVSALAYLTKGFNVRLGELGSFSTRIKSKSAPTLEEFTPELIEKAHVRFTPSTEMKGKISRTGFLNVDELLKKSIETEGGGTLPSNPTEEDDGPVGV
ncbi:MAG: HU family DNA-binding protein [Porphyromonas sp.]|nr:HU family DNA-binding protein [Porphyromonas sp.]